MFYVSLTICTETDGSQLTSKLVSKSQHLYIGTKISANSQSENGKR